MSKTTTYLIDHADDPDAPKVGAVYSAAHGARTIPGLLRALGELLDRVADTAPGTELVALLTAPAMQALGLPDTAPAGGHWPGLDTVRGAHGWQVSGLTAWTTFHRAWGRGGRTVIHVGFGPWAVAVSRCPLLEGTTPAALARFDSWAERTGRAWHGTPGVAGVSLLRAHYQGAGGTAQHRPGLTPRWQLGPAVPEHVARAGLERDFTLDWAPGALELGAHRHEYDTNMAYLAAAMVARVARDGLEHMPRLLVDERRERKLAGYFLADLGPWHDGRLPDPAGIRPRAQRKGAPSARWVTGPTLDLLDELHETGFGGGYTILDAYAAKGVTVLRPWAELLRDTIGQAREAGDTATVAAGKAAYREAIGMVGRPGGLVYRPDWQSAVIAQARANLWRKLRVTGLRTGHWPTAIDVDAVTYTTDTADPRELAAELGITLDPARLGAWKHKATSTAAAVPAGRITA